MVEPVRVPGALGGGCPRLARCSQSPHLPADRRHRSGAHHFSAGEDWRIAQLGLPLLLASRRHVHPLRPAVGGYVSEAKAWREWLVRAVAGDEVDDCELNAPGAVVGVEAVAARQV
jgi:hypothetical protein